jgi:hypothetical protein
MLFRCENALKGKLLPYWVEEKSLKEQEGIWLRNVFGFGFLMLRMRKVIVMSSEIKVFTLHKYSTGSIVWFCCFFTHGSVPCLNQQE